jgi:hypothetical protein
MTHERYSKQAMIESLNLSYQAELHQKVLEALINLPDPLPDSNSGEALKLSNSLKPLRYALFAIAIEDILKMDDQPEPVNIVEPCEAEDSDDFIKLRAFLSRQYNLKTEKYFETPNQTAVDIQMLTSVRHKMQPDSWDSAEWAILGGFGTMTSTSTALLEAFNIRAKQIDLDSPNKERALRKSFQPLIEIASLDALQLAAVTCSFEEDNFPAVVYDPSKNLLKFNDSIQRLKLGPDTLEYLSRHVSTLDNLRTVADVSNTEIVIGCPVLFRPHQVKDLWNETVDLAKEMQLI